jgi:cytochrome P450
VGAPLAKLELEVAMEAIRSLTRLELASEQLERVPSLVFRGVKKLRLDVA